jgi:GNAT superfamily N-acetyltransferase
MEIIEIPASRLDEYARIPIAFEVRSIFDVELQQNGLGGIHLHERTVSPYIKDCDVSNPPLSWPDKFDLKHWGIFLMMDRKKPVGGVAVAWNTAGADMLEGRSDLSVLWDIRVLQARRGWGLGKRLFRHAAAWSKERGCLQMKMETQNVNVNACHFYASQGARLGDIRRFAYRHEPSVAHEIQLNWYFDC